jgi:Na+-transporting methylmalonyl-CoA/oxaloacetate decarboxylase gamma subunit
LAPLIPATFSSALGLIILITLTRFVSNFVLTDKKNPPKEQDYSAIAVLVKEIGSVVNTLRGKENK